MLPPEPGVISARQGFPDAQAAMAGAATLGGYYQLSWYGSEISDERGSFALVNSLGPLRGLIGNYVQLAVRTRSVNVYVIGSLTNLLGDIATTRRCYMALSLLAEDPVTILLSVLT